MARSILVVVGSIVGIVILLAVVGFWPGSTKKIEAMANQFQPSGEWKLQSERISPPRFICLQADCGEVRRVWVSEAAHKLQEQDFLYQIKAATQDQSVTHVCEYTTDKSTIASCDATFIRDGKEVTLSYRSNGVTSQPTLIYNLTPERG